MVKSKKKQNLGFTVSNFLCKIILFTLASSARRPYQEILVVILTFQIAIVSRKLVLVVLMEKQVSHGFATPHVINGITNNVVKFNCLTSSLEIKRSV